MQCDKLISISCSAKNAVELEWLSDSDLIVSASEMTYIVSSGALNSTH